MSPGPFGTWGFPHCRRRQGDVREGMENPPERSAVELTIPWRTIFKIFAAALLAYAAFRLRRFIELFFLSLLIAVAFRPLLHRLERSRWPKWTGVLITGVVLFGSAALLFGMLIPAVSSQGTQFVKSLPEFKTHLQQRLPESGPVRNLANEFFSNPAFSNPEPLLKQVLAWGGTALERVAEFFVVLVLAVYLVADGRRVFEWLAAFLPERERRKLPAAADEITLVVGHYVAGNVITSVLAAIYALIVLEALRVPNAILLALLAGIFDFLPIIGFFLFTIPAALLALTVSPAAALLVAVLYGAYHVFENYFLVPRVYGNRLRLSELTVLLSCLAAGLLAGVIGVLLVLPLVASYPIVERYWLRPYLERDTVKRHDRIEAREYSRSE
jgi:predicted PurR-regulated permease PerM